MSFETITSTRFVRSLCFLIAVACVPAMTGCNSESPIEVIAHDPGDVLTLHGDRIPTLTIHSPSGIGRAALRSAGGEWPESIDVSLCLGALEGFVVRNGSEVHRLELTAAREVLLEPENAALELLSLDSTAVPPCFAVRISLGAFAEPIDELRVEWVDYYR